MSARTLEWLSHHRFHEMTGIAAADVHFVRARPDKDEVCRRAGVTHFVDDRLDVLEALTIVSHRYLFLGALGSVGRLPSRESHRIVLAHTWPQLASQIRVSVPQQPGPSAARR